MMQLPNFLKPGTEIRAGQKQSQGFRREAPRPSGDCVFGVEKIYGKEPRSRLVF